MIPLRSSKHARAIVASIVPDQLVTACVHGSEKVHLVRFRSWKDRPDPDGGLFDGTQLCGVNREGRWYWRILIGSFPDVSRCRRCFQAWRARGNPPVRGWTEAGEPVTVVLPFSWSEVPAC